MSQYLSSFLIEPVIRQARRFSRQGDDDRPFCPSNVRPSSNNGAEIPQRDPCVHADATSSDYIRQMALDPLDPQVTDMATAEPDTDPSVAGPHVHQPLGTSHGESSRVAPPPDNARFNDQVTSNPVPSVTESPQPTTSSLSGPARSVIYPYALEPPNSAQSITQYPTDTGPASARIGDQALPEDDGMASKRRQIVAIHDTHSSETERARLVHDLMNEGRSSLQPNQKTSHAPSLLILAPHDEPNRPASGHGANTIVPPMTPTACPLASADANNPFNLSGEDLRPTYYQKPMVQPSTTGHDNRSLNRLSQDSIQENTVFGCPHYRRNIKLQCSRCCRWYTCRFCHDEVEDHPLNRPETKNMLCMFCGSAQPASGHCTHCGEPSARYYCIVCKFWDNTPGKSIYHCNDCGICRVGEGLGKDFFHCKTCNACLSIRTMENHRCIERSTERNCPICSEYMFTSPQAVVFMRCGHAIHHMCYYEHVKQSYRCPLCSKSIANMEASFRQLERSIESQPMPDQWEHIKALVSCNDCNAKSYVKYHWLGLKCGVCDSFNTALLERLHAADQGSIVHGPTAQSAVAGSAISTANQPQRAVDRVTPAAVISPTQNATPSGSQNLAAFAREAVAINARRVSAEGSSDGDYSDVDFWGLESPNARGARISLCEPAEHDDSGEEDSPGNANIDDFEAPGDADDDDDDDDEMEIFGHW